jgi:two-component system sensor histidine kinase TctE
VALLWYGVGRGLAPLVKLRDEIAPRSPRDLCDVPVKDKPSEVAPIVMALNGLLGQLKSAIERQQRFIANAAHQLRTPLAGLKMHTELARRQPATVEMKALLDMIAGEAERGAHLANQLLALARAEPDIAAAAARDPVNLHEIGSRAVQTWLARALAKDIDLGFELQDAWIAGDPLLMRELMANLIDNTIAYTAQGGHVTVRTREEGGVAVIELEDDGPGTPAGERERVFERFYRVQGTPGEGCGLGLAIVAEIANRHGGTTALLAPERGRGTLVRVGFPMLARGTRSRTPASYGTGLSETAPSSR